MGTCETVKIKTENGPVIINKSDYDPKKHEIIKDKEDKKESKKAK